jgi:NAD(P)-dependent dehydrogenase (short-subunit alcohol dehydrogenase family)
MSESKKTILITGAAGGVGRATVKLFHERGFRVIGVDRQSVYAEFPADGLFIQADISVPENLEKIIAQATQFSSTLDLSLIHI